GPQAKDAVPAIIRALPRIKVEDGWDRLGVELLARHFFGSLGTASMPALTEALKDKDEEVREFARKWLLELQEMGAGKVSKGIIQDLIASLKAERPYDRQEAARGLGQLGPEARPAVPALIVALKDRAVEVRAVSAEALSRIGPAANDAVSAL